MAKHIDVGSSGSPYLRLFLHIQLRAPNYASPSKNKLVVKVLKIKGKTKNGALKSNQGLTTSRLNKLN